MTGREARKNRKRKNSRSDSSRNKFAKRAREWICRCDVAGAEYANLHFGMIR